MAVAIVYPSANRVVDAIPCFEIGRPSLAARVAVEEFVCASWGRCTRRSLGSCSCSVGQVAEVVPLYRGILAADVDRRMCRRPGEREEVSRVGVEERIDNVERAQVLRTPDLLSRGEREIGPDDRREGRLTRTVLSPVDPVICGGDGTTGHIPEELNSQCLSGAYTRARTLPV